MADNPYSKLIKIMRKHGREVNPPSIMLGEVISINPLTIKTGGLQIDKDNILVADYLLAGYERKFDIQSVNKDNQQLLGQTTEANLHTHELDSIAINNGSITFQSGLKEGDMLALLPTVDMQTFIVLCKVVSIS